jgi:hypothetical protein
MRIPEVTFASFLWGFALNTGMQLAFKLRVRAEWGTAPFADLMADEFAA